MKQARYYHLYDDGASMHCNLCGESFNGSMLIIVFTPDNKLPSTLCFDCVDTWWLAHATDMGEYTNEKANEEMKAFRR